MDSVSKKRVSFTKEFGMNYSTSLYIIHRGPVPLFIKNLSNNLRPVTLCLTRFLRFTFLPKRTLSSPPANAEVHLRLTRIRKINTSHHSQIKCLVTSSSETENSTRCVQFAKYAVPLWRTRASRLTRRLTRSRRLLAVEQQWGEHHWNVMLKSIFLTKFSTMKLCADFSM